MSVIFCKEIKDAYTTTIFTCLCDKKEFKIFIQTKCLQYAKMQMHMF